MDAYSNDFKKTVLSLSFSLRYQLVHRCDVSSWSSFYVPLRHCRNISNRSVLLTQQLRRDDVSAWSRTLKLVTKLGQFLLGTKAVHFSQTSGGSASLRPVLRHIKNVGLTQLLLATYLRRHKQACLIQIQVVTSY